MLLTVFHCHLDLGIIVLVITGINVYELTLKLSLCLSSTT